MVEIPLDVAVEDSHPVLEPVRGLSAPLVSTGGAPGRTIPHATGYGSGKRSRGCSNIGNHDVPEASRPGRPGLRYSPQSTDTLAAMARPPALPVALTIAGSDPSGGAGLQIDLKVFQQHGVFGAAAVTLLTVQNTRGVSRVEVMEPQIVLEQVRAVTEDLPVAAAKTGALGSAAMIEAVADLAGGFVFPLVVDPVMVSKHGHPLLPDDAVAALRECLLPKAALLTPNLHELYALTDGRFDLDDDAGRRAAAECLLAAGAAAVVVKGGADAARADDLLVTPEAVLSLPGERFATDQLHGTGCAFAAAITARLARGEALPDAVGAAKDFVTRALRRAPGLGGGRGPIDPTVPADRPC